MIELLFEEFVRTGRFKTVAEIINAEGHRTAYGTYFTGQSVARILRDKKHLEESSISQELWDQCQDILAANKRVGGSRRRVAHLCSGLLKCSCGKTMYVPTNSRKYVCSKCLTKIAKDDLETIVLENMGSSASVELSQTLQLWAILPLSEKREIVENVVQEVRVDGKRVTIALYAAGSKC